MAVSLKPLLRAGFDLKGLKKWNTRDGGGYQFTLTHRGVAVAEVTNDGNGGPTDLRWISLRWDGEPLTFPSASPATLAKIAKEAPLSRAAKDALDAIVAGTPPVANEYDPSRHLTVDAGWLMEELVNLPDLRKVCKKKTAFRKAGGDDTSYFTINAPCDDKVRAYIAQKYPGAMILNDEVAA